MGRVLAILIWLLTLGSVALFLNGNWWFPVGATEHAAKIDSQFLITIIVVGVAFATAQIGLGWTIWRYRDSGQGGRAMHTHGNNRLEVIWTVVTALIFISLGVMGQRVWAQLHFNAAPAGAYQVEVVAQQFQWSFHYPGLDNRLGRTDPKLIDDSNLNYIGLDETDPDAKDDAVAATLVLPVNRPIAFTLRSKDVTHSFWVPPFRFKQDLVPGLKIQAHLVPSRVGKFELACAELCGQLHYKMKAWVLVIPEDEHNALVALPQAEFQKRVQELLNKYPTQE
jgi:cytochrome c oxidase subunit 2